jgi:hypothetical protein
VPVQGIGVYFSLGKEGVLYSSIAIFWERMMESISIHELARVIDYLEQINDPRRRTYGNIRYKLAGIIVIAFTVVLCGYEDKEAAPAWSRRQDPFAPNRLIGD